MLRIALAQFNPIVGDLAGNADKIRDFHTKAAAEKADLLMLPELAICGYSPEDLLLRPAFQGAVMDAVIQLAKDCDSGPAILLGGVWGEMEGVHNAAFLLEGGEIRSVQRKHALPNYGVFDERRHFKQGPLPRLLEWRGHRIGLLVCEDMWTEMAPAALMKEKEKPECWLVINASPYDPGKQARRKQLARDLIDASSVPLVYLNLVGGQDEVVFDGASFAMEKDGDITVQLPAFEEAFAVISLDKNGAVRGPQSLLPETPEAQWKAACMGLRDYVEKNHFPGVLLGLSGGIDSALVAAIATDALGADKVHPVLLPSPYTSDVSLAEARETAANLGLKLREIPIGAGMDAVDAMLAESFKGEDADVTEENIQSRLRGLVLMALSNKFGWMLMTTGNKSEIAVGYATLYGDMCGGYNPIKDLYKTEVYALARWRNLQTGLGLKGPAGKVIPERTITRAPSAELRANQTDQDSLPPYEELDAILRLLVEEAQPISAIIALGHEEAVVMKVAKLLRGAEYKRRQSAPGAKLSITSFGRDWRMPLTNKYLG